jgi:diacylglycerol kinase family enzyme
VRALYIINPRATAASGRTADRVVRELDAGLDLETAQTRYRGHAGELAAQAATVPGDSGSGYDLIVTFGGDGTVNEVVNGIMNATGGDCGSSRRPAIAPIPGGGANVFARTLGLPPGPLRAARKVLEAAHAGAARTIGLGLASSPEWNRYFTFSAGLGVDAEVVADMERLRAKGERESAPLFMWAALRRFYTTTDRTHPALSMEAPGMPPESGLFMGVITNSSPWTYVGNQPFSPAPHTDFNSGLDVFALRRLRTLTTLNALAQMTHPRRPVVGRDMVSAAELPGLTFQASRPIAFHIDGEYLGETEKVAFRHLPSALRVFA